MPLFFYLFSFMMVFSAIGVITSRNPVYSVLWLIFTLLNSSGLFVMLGAEFVAMTVIIVYVGAVAVLFLFIVMMLDINSEEIKERIWQNKISGILLMGFFVSSIILLTKASFLKEGKNLFNTNTIPQVTSNAHAIGEVLYTKYFMVFQTAGLILLLAMVGCIVLTLRNRHQLVKKQNVYEQLARDPMGAVKLVKVKVGDGVDEINYR